MAADQIDARGQDRRRFLKTAASLPLGLAAAQAAHRTSAEPAGDAAMPTVASRNPRMLFSPDYS